MIGDFYGDGNRYRGVTSCDPETKSYTIIGGDMDNNTMREFWENQIKDANKRIAALEEDLKFNAGLLAKQCDRAMDLEAENAALKEQFKQKDTYIEMQQADLAEMSNEIQKLRDQVEMMKFAIYYRVTRVGHTRFYKSLRAENGKIAFEKAAEMVKEEKYNPDSFYAFYVAPIGYSLDVYKKYRHGWNGSETYP